MEVTLQQETLPTERLVGKASLPYLLEGKLNLPEGSPPQEGIKGCYARVRELRATAGHGSVSLEGLVEVELSYLGPAGDNERLTQREHRADWTAENGGAVAFAYEVPLAGVTPESRIEAAAEVTGTVAEALEASSLRYQINLGLAIAAMSLATVTVGTEAVLTSSDHPEVVKEVLNFEIPLGLAETETVVSSVLALPEVKPDLVRIAAAHVRLLDLKAESIRGRIVAQGRLAVNVVYVSQNQDGDQGLAVQEWGGESRFPLAFEAFLDLPGLEPDAVILPTARLGRCNIEAIGPREIRVDTTWALSIQATLARPVAVITEVTPGPADLVDLRRLEVAAATLAAHARQEFAVEGNLELPSAKPAIERILQVRAVPHSLTAQAAEGRCLLDGWLDVALFYQDESGDLGVMNWARNQGTGIAVTEVLKAPEIQPSLDLFPTWQIERIEAEQISPRLVRFAATVAVRVKATEDRVISAIADAAVVPLAPIPGRPSMLFYLVQPGDTLWEIARRYNTTVAALTSTNKIADPETLETGRKLLIPRSPVAV